MTVPKIPLTHALLWILGSTLLISGIAFMGWLYFLHMKEQRLQDDQFRIVAIVQSTPQVDALKTAFLAEILDLSMDQPCNLYQFNSTEAVQTLLSHPLIKEAAIKKILPGTLYIHYQMRTPVAYLGNYHNTALDEEGMLFPFRPFFTPKHLPILFMNLEKEKCKWGETLRDNPSLKLAFSILEQFYHLKQGRFRIKQLDVSQAQADSYGQREIVLILEEYSQDWNPSPRHASLIYLRLNADHAAQSLANFSILLRSLFEKKELLLVKESLIEGEPLVLDLRIPHLAYIKRRS